ncbi:cupin domain-containing protein [uncultured Croceitalea sp.]|uniref:cupin domain-containing protein n=1 Tax=uncultured Croceitalea sp. TaxID=1798908 RepID=UPI00374F22ED
MEYTLDEIEVQEIMPGYRGKLVHSETMSWVFWDVEKDAEVPMHHHIHEQIMHVVSGDFEFTLNGKTKIYKPGSIVVIPSNIPHSGKALTACKLMDVFSPARNEYKL